MTDKNELAETRRANLLAWMDEKQISRTDLSTKLEVGRAYISLLFKPDRFFGEKAARSIEKKLGIPTGYLDSDGKKPQVVEKWSKPEDISDGMYAMVPRVDIRLSAGAGATPDTEPGLPPLAFRKDWLQKRNVSKRSALRIVGVQGDSMAPYIQSGDIVMIDTGQTDIQDHQIYAIEHSGEVRIKRLSKRFDGGLLIRSDGPGFPEESLSPEQAQQLRVLGRMLWRAG